MSDPTYNSQPGDLGQPDQASQASELDQSLQALNLTKDNPLLIPEIMAEVFSHIPSNDSGTAARMTEVNRQWWHVGHGRVWREGFNQLSGLVNDIDDPNRREYFASLIETIHFQPGDTILSTEKTRLQSLKFPRLESIHMDVSNLSGLKADNLEALLVPSLRSLHLQAQGGSWEGDREKDCETFLKAVFDNKSITTLSLDFNNELPASWSVELLLTHWLDRAEQLEHLELNRLSESLIRRCPPNLLFEKLLEYKPHLVSLCFPQGALIRQEHVDAFLSIAGADWSIPSLKVIKSAPDYTPQRPPVDSDVPHWSTPLPHESNAPRFATALPAAQLLDRMPNLEELAIVFEGEQEPVWGDQVACVFDALSKLKHLKKLELDARVPHANFRGEWLTQLATLTDLEHVEIDLQFPSEVSITGAQMVRFLTSLPKLKRLDLDFHGYEVYCSAEEKEAIEGALGKIDDVGLYDMTLKIREANETEE